MITFAQQLAVQAAVEQFLAAQQELAEQFIGNAYAHGRDAVAELAGAAVIEATLEAARVADLMDAHFQLIISVAGKWISGIQEIVSSGYLTGDSPVDIASRVSGYFDRMPGNWGVIARDQIAKAQFSGRDATYEQMGQEWVEVTCAPDACDECTPHDGDIVRVGDYGSRPQFHIQCACMDIPFDKED